MLNIHELILQPSTFTELFDSSSLKDKSTSQASSKKSKSQSSRNPSSKPRGRPSVVSKYPSIITIVTEFIKQHGYKAQERRRTETGTTCGVTLREIREHMMQTIPELQEYGIGTTTIAYLMAPLTVGIGLQNDIRQLLMLGYRVKTTRTEKTTFARVAYRREFAQMFQSECAVFSCDDMNKIKVGPLAVSRYHQISKIFTCPSTQTIIQDTF